MQYFIKCETLKQSREFWLKRLSFTFNAIVCTPDSVRDWRHKYIIRRSDEAVVTWSCEPKDHTDTLEFLVGVIDAPLVRGARAVINIQLHNDIVPWFETLISEDFIETQALMYDVFLGAECFNPYRKLEHKHVSNGIHKVWATQGDKRTLLCTRTQEHTLFPVVKRRWYYADPKCLVRQLGEQLHIPQHLL